MLKCFANSEKRKKKIFPRGFNFANWLPVNLPENLSHKQFLSLWYKNL